MAYIALKVVNFDKRYQIGEHIPEEVIAPNMVVKLIKCNVIQQIEETEESLKEKAEADEPPKEKAKTSKQPKKV